MKSNNWLSSRLEQTIVLSLLLLAGCYNPDKPVNSQANPDIFFKTLLVIGDDRSGSTSDIRKLTKEDYRMLFETIGSKGGGAVAVCLIGNPSPQKREPYSLSLKTLNNIQYYDPKDPGLTLTEKGNLKAQNENTRKLNEGKLNAQRNEINSFITKELESNVIKYIPSGPDDTDLDDAIDRINTLIHEPLYTEFDKIIIALISDGKNEPHSRITPIKSKLSAPNAELFLVGWETATECFTVRNTHKMSSKDGFIEMINNLK
jgi:hypothetical protein